MKVPVVKSRGKVTEVCKYSLLDDQITIEVKIPSKPGLAAETRVLDWAVPAGSVKVGMTVTLAFIE
jgi:hypothetical protein